MITIYGKDNCGFCTKAKNLCDIRQLEYAYVDVGLTQNLNELKEKWPNFDGFVQLEQIIHLHLILLLKIRNLRQKKVFFFVL